MIFLDTTHTSHCRANTGIQRVTRRIYRELGPEGVPVIYDRFGAHWRQADANETELMVYGPEMRSGRKRGAVWSFSQKWRGRLVPLGMRRRGEPPDHASALIVPEIFAPPRTPEVYAALRQRVDGPAVALFHDLIPLLMPGHTPAETVAKFESYLAALRTFDVVAAISEFSRDSLTDYWRNRGESHPPVVAVPLGVDVPATAFPDAESRADGRLRILCVGTLEGRKNHLALLRAAESLWSAGLDFELTLFGGLNRETALAAENLASELSGKGRPLRRIRGGSDSQMEAEYVRADFTVYPSLMEGFGLPVLESLARGRPCVCSGENAMAETIHGGGCLAVGEPSETALADGLRLLIESPAKLAELTREARARPIRTWTEYATDLRRLVLSRA